MKSQFLAPSLGVLIMDRRSAVSYQKLLQSLLPKGKLWNRNPDSVLGGVLLAEADELSRVDGRGFDLLNERSVLLTDELILEHEADYAILDIDGKTMAERRTVLYTKLLATGRQNKEYFEELIIMLGKVPTIEDFKPAWAGVMVAGDPCGDQDQLFYWLIWIETRKHEGGFSLGFNNGFNSMRAGGDYYDLYTDYMDIDEVVSQISGKEPAHMTLLYDYRGMGYGRGFSCGFNAVPVMPAVNYYLSGYEKNLLLYRQKYPTLFSDRILNLTFEDDQFIYKGESDDPTIEDEFGNSGNFSIAPDRVDGLQGQGLRFDSSINYLSLNNPIKRNYDQDWTINFWIKLNENKIEIGGTNIFACISGNPIFMAPAIVFNYQTFGTATLLLLMVYDVPTGTIGNLVVILNTNGYIQLSIKHNGSENTTYGVIDAGLNEHGIGSSFAWTAPSFNLDFAHLGSMLGTYQLYADIDEVTMYDRFLSDAELLQLRKIYLEQSEPTPEYTGSYLVGAFNHGFNIGFDRYSGGGFSNEAFTTGFLRPN